MVVSPRRRLTWFAAVAFVAMFGFGEFAGFVLQASGPDSWWGIDLKLVLDAGTRLVAGQDLYGDPRFLYPPLAAVVGAPLAPLPFDIVSVAYAGLKVAIAVACVATLTTGWRLPARVLAVVGLVMCLPFLHDVMLGNANVVLVAAALPAVVGPPRPRSGVLLGLATAVVAKPLVVPIFLWLLVWRRPAFVGAVASGLAATLVGLMLAGPWSYAEWVGALAAGTRYATPFAGNHGVTALVPELWLPVAVIVAIGLLLVLLRRGPETGLAWAVTAGLLLAPYAGTYGALPIALALPGMALLAPTMALVVVAVSPIATTHPLPIYAAAILVGALAYREAGTGRQDRRATARAWLARVGRVRRTTGEAAQPDTLT